MPGHARVDLPGVQRVARLLGDARVVVLLGRLDLRGDEVDGGVQRVLGGLQGGLEFAVHAAAGEAGAGEK